jgi:hypothetical protein
MVPKLLSTASRKLKNMQLRPQNTTSSVSPSIHSPEEKSVNIETSALHPGLSQKALVRNDIRIACIAVVVLSGVVSIAITVLGTLVIRTQQALPKFLEDKCTEWNYIPFSFAGIHLYMRRHFVFPSPEAGPLLLLLGWNLALTALLDAHSRVATNALTWFLLDEGSTPKYNTNSRLLTSTRKFGM